MADRKSDGMNPWLRMSAWLPPGLALGWLAVLATFVHNVACMLIAWGATIILVIVVIMLTGLLGQLRRNVSSRHPPETAGSAAPRQGAGSDGPQPASAAENALTSGSRAPDSLPGLSSATENAPSGNAPRSVPDRPAPGTADSTEPLGTAEIAVTLGLHVLTAEEAASVLRVKTDEITTAIRNGELPGNRVGDQWRLDQRALAHWVQGAYGYVSYPRSPSPTKPETGQTQ
jgi:excisionase family DNA binding protein